MTVKAFHYAATLLLIQLLSGCDAPPSSTDVAQQQPARQEQAAPAVQPQAPADVNQPERLVVAFGDSLYAGYGLDRNEGLAPELQRALEAQGIKATVYNAGVSGETTAGGRKRLAFTLDGLPRKPDLVMIGLGANDMLRGLDPEQAKENLDAMLAELKSRGIPAALTGMIAAPNMGSAYAAKFNPIYAELARKYDVPLYPFLLDGVVGEQDLLLPDGLHPNAAGVDRIAAGVAPMVAAALKPAPN